MIYRRNGYPNTETELFGQRVRGWLGLREPVVASDLGPVQRHDPIDGDGRHVASGRGLRREI